MSEIDDQTYAYHFQEPLGVVGQIIPFDFPLLMGAWKIAPALAAGNCTALKPASPAPWSSSRSTPPQAHPTTTTSPTPERPAGQSSRERC